MRQHRYRITVEHLVDTDGRAGRQSRSRGEFADPDGGSSAITPRGRFMANNITMLLLLAEQGFGIALLPPALAKPLLADGRLEPVLARSRLSGWPVHAVTSTRTRTAATQEFLDFVVESLVTREFEILR